MTQVFDFRRKLGEGQHWCGRHWDWPLPEHMPARLWVDGPTTPVGAHVGRAVRHIAAYQANPSIANERVRQDRDWARFFGIEYHSPATAESEEP